jgi:hypothetical protein
VNNIYQFWNQLNECFISISLTKHFLTSQLKIMIKYTLFIFYFVTLILPVFAQPTTHWQKTYGGSNNEDARCVSQTLDGGYILVGFTLSTNGDVIGSHGGGDIWVLKLDSGGNLEWKKTYGGTDLDVGYAIQQCNDGGYIMAGTVFSKDGDVSGHHDDDDAWVVKLDNQGNIEWQRALGGSGWDEARCIQQTTDGGFIMAGWSGSLDGDVTGNHGALDFWLVKLNPTGAIQWQKSLGGSSIDMARSLKATDDGGYIVAGQTMSNDGQVSGNNGNDDYWVVKLDSFGAIEWQNTLGGTGSDIGQSVALCNDTGYYVVGTTGSANNGDVMGYHGGLDVWVVKLSKLGEIEWSLALGGSEPDHGYAISKTIDDGCIVAGSTESQDGDVQGNDGGADLWVIKLSEGGIIEWQKTLGGTQAEQGFDINQVSDDGFIATGFTRSNDGDVTDNSGGKDYWVIKLAPESSPTTQPTTQPLNLYPNPATQSITIQIPESESTLNIQITDLLGRELGRQTIPNGGTVDIETLPNGLYLVLASTESGEVFLGRVCKQE